jgi:hypothetical protein
MKPKMLCALTITLCLLAGAYESSGATVPAGTVFVARIMHSIAATDSPGMPFDAQLQSNITSNGKVLIPAGAHLSGKVATSRRLAHSRDKLTVDMIAVQSGGRNIPIKTTGAQFLNNDIRTSSGVSVSRANYTVPAGKQLQFKLAQPVVL